MPWTVEDVDGLRIWTLAEPLQGDPQVAISPVHVVERGKRRRPLSGPSAAPPAMLHEAPMPPGPYRRALTRYDEGRTGRPYVILAIDGQCVAGWINSRAAADAIVAALNAQYPA